MPRLSKHFFFSFVGVSCTAASELLSMLYTLISELYNLSIIFPPFFPFFPPTPSFPWMDLLTFSFFFFFLVSTSLT